MPIAEGIRYLREGKEVHPNLKGFDPLVIINNHITINKRRLMSASEIKVLLIILMK